MSCSDGTRNKGIQGLYFEAMEDLISVLIPVYNVETYLPTCLDSVIAQTYKHIEILIVDDGSTDGTGKICDRYAQGDIRIRAIHKKNEGQSVARNLLIKEAKGEYICFVDGDDVVMPTYIETLHTLVAKYKCKIAVSVLRTFRDGSRPSIVKPRYQEVLLSPLHAVEWMNYQEKFDTWPVCKLYHRSIFDSGLRYPEGQIFEDFAITYLLLMESDSVAYCNQVNYFYRLRKDSTEGEAFSEKKMSAALSVLHSLEEHKHSLMPIIKSYKCRIVSFAYHCLLKMPKDYGRRDVFEKIIKDYRFTVLFDKRARKKTRLACFASLFGFQTVEFLFSFVDKRKE